MPEIRYTVEIEGDKFSERDFFKATRDATQFVQQEIIDPWNKSRAEKKDPLVSLVKVEVLNPFVHLHDWKKTHSDKFGGRSYYFCTRCKITGWRVNRIMDGDLGEVHRDESWKPVKFELCRDPLKEMPKKLF